MNKGLEALENIKHYDSRIGLHESDYDIIETALKEYEGAKAHIEALHKERVETSLKLEA